ncbi:MAG: hypothetical protein HQK56_11190 [Deltaproteobacteria bacterium]|nr:hypothetical protein [Deltaproteobacteria bacterium]
MNDFRLKIQYSKRVDKFLVKNSAVIMKDHVRNAVISAVKKILKIEDNNIDVIQLSGALRGSCRIRTGKIRIIFELIQEETYVAFVDKVFFRKDAYR